MHYKNKQEPLDQIGRELGVQYVLEGSVRRESEKVRITAQLIQTKDQTHLWSREYDRDVSHLLLLQEQIAQEVAGEIRLTLGNNQKLADGAHQASLTPQAYEAYDLYHSKASISLTSEQDTVLKRQSAISSAPPKRIQALRELMQDWLTVMR